MCSFYSLILLSLVGLVFAYPEGAPDKACSTLTPEHEDDALQSSTAPFTITTDKTRVMANSEVMVKIRSKEDSATNMFKGFLMVARKTGTEDITGMFMTMDSNAQTLNCTMTSDAVTHTNNNDKSEIMFKWVPSPSFKGPVMFTATIVKDYEHFWKNVKSKAITVI